MSSIRYAICVLAALASSAAAQVSFTDGDFDAADWSHTILHQNPVATLGPMIAHPTGGNPGGYQEGFHSTDGFGASIYDGHTYLPFTYNPSTQGAINTIDVSYSWFDLNPGSVQSGLLLEQSGNTYIIGVTTDGAWSGWKTFSRTGLTLTSFEWRRVTPGGVFNDTPNFSLSGGPIRFGYYTFNWSPSGGLVERAWAIDNFHVSINDPCSADSTPVASITAPDPLTCLCDPVLVFGSAFDNEVEIASYTLEHRPFSGGPWTTFFTGSTPVLSSILGAFDPGSLPQEDYLLRLTVTNVCGNSNTDVIAVWVDQQFDEFAYTSPLAGDIVGGTVCALGTVNDHCAEGYIVDYLPTGGSYQPIEPGVPDYPGPIINGTLGEWDTIAGAIADGSYYLRVTPFDECGTGLPDKHLITIDNTPPTTEIFSPDDCTWIDGVVSIVGTAFDTNMGSWSLQYAGGDSGDWVTIASGTTNVVNSVLGSWDTSGLEQCSYALRLIASDTAVIDCSDDLHNTSETVISVNVGCPADFNGDGLLNTVDVLDFLNSYSLGCP